ncbi:alpha-L-rhamnosidase-related protein [Bythopirellula polymerisocia]|uniref:Bacterial alpha-L-rhamnosidase n=1 Tax=Bythopirellula polymerisocia TaxID=2528003 RepID=A0A5C6CVR9_9BACT|nr:GH116 family glycosyl hydrolase [Bythopirellula polymerisocia]TWU28652.1 Bacterial alpha-L-rhamnosidase [Bythopirellula polymerisocia]
MNRLLLLILSIVLNVTGAVAETSPVDWKAQWIWQKEAGPTNTWMAFRKEFKLTDVPAKAVASIAVDSKYWIWVNGEMAHFEGGIARGPNPNDTYYEELDLAPFLKKGENTVAVLVWYWGRSRKCHLDSGQGGLVLQADLGKTRLVTDRSWKMKVHPAYDSASGGGGNHRQVPQFNVKFDANNALGDWTDGAWYTAEFDDSNWRNAVEKGVPPTAPWNLLIKNRVPLLKDNGLKYYDNYPPSKFPFVSPGGKITCKLPFNKQITPYLEVESKSGQTIRMRVDNSANRVVGIYKTCDGEQAFESYVWMNGHEVVYLIPKGVTVKALKYRWTGVGEMTGTFECSDPFLTRLWWMARNTLYVCARDNFMDCPDRERGLWIGDVADQSGPVFYTMDEAGRQLLKKAIDVTVRFSRDDIIAGLAPGFQDEFVMQSLQFISQGIWHYYYNTGDAETIANAYPVVRAYLSLWSIDEDGVLSWREGDTSWPDWGKHRDRKPIQPCLYYMAAQAAADMATLLGKPDDAAMFKERMERMKSAFNQQYWNESYYTSGELKDDRANALAILSGLAGPEKYDSIVKNVLIPEQNASPHMEWMVEEAMIKAGYLDEAIDRMMARYIPQVELEVRTTLDEYMGVREGGTYNHAWNAPNYILSKYIAGVAADSVAWEAYYVKPNLLNLSSVKQVVPSVKGDITVDIKLANKTFTMKLISPEGTMAVVGIPKASIAAKVIEANGSIIWKNGVFTNNISGITWNGQDGNYITFKVVPGTWKFIAKAE